MVFSAEFVGAELVADVGPVVDEQPASSKATHAANATMRTGSWETLIVERYASHQLESVFEPIWAGTASGSYTVPRAAHAAAVTVNGPLPRRSRATASRRARASTSRLLT